MGKDYRHFTKYPAWFIEELVNKEDREDAKKGILPRSKKVTLFCKDHGSYLQTPSNHIDFKTMSLKGGCPECGRRLQIEKSKITKRKVRKSYPEWFINELAHDEDRIKVKNKELSTGDRVDFLCPVHGIYSMTVFNHIRLKTGLRLRGCPECAKADRREHCIKTKMENRPDYPVWFIEELFKEEDKERAMNKCLRYNEKVSFYCKDHGVYTQIVADHIEYKTGEKKQGCPKCGIIKRNLNKKERNKQKRPDYPEWFIEDIASEEDKDRARNKELTWSDKVNFLCPIHGVYKQRIDAHMNTSTLTPKQGCPSCGILLSKSEIEISDFIKSLGVEIEKRNRSLIKEKASTRFLELDIFIPDKNIAIEYNGSYWHGELHKKDKKSNLNKSLLCAEQGIRLISIYDRDWKENKDKISNFLKDLLVPKIRIYGRCTEVRTISLQEAKKFYDENHLKGSGNHNKISYGLFYNGSLVSAMSFSKPNFGNQRKVEWDLTRYCVKFGYSVIGGAEKLFKTFIKEFNPSNVITYSDNDYFTGEVYSRLGFLLDKITSIPYYWAKSDHIFLNREVCQVHKLKEKYPDIFQKSIDENASNKEDYIMHTLGYYKVYRCGNKRWIWKSTI